jgi:hypothetical protein
MPADSSSRTLHVMATGSGGEASRGAGGYEGIDEHRLKHLEFILAVVARLAGNSFLVKGWAITVAGVFIGFALNQNEIRLALAALIPTVAFWGLDAYFLTSERLFRALYDQVRKSDEHIEPFFMSATDKEFVRRVRDGQTDSSTEVASFWKTALRRTLAWFYLPLIGASSMVAIIVHGSV